MFQNICGTLNAYLDFVSRLVFTMFQKMDLLPSSGRRVRGIYSVQYVKKSCRCYSFAAQHSKCLSFFDRRTETNPVLEVLILQNTRQQTISEITVIPSVMHPRQKPLYQIRGNISVRLRKIQNRKNTEVFASHGSADIIVRRCGLGTEQKQRQLR